MSRQYPRVVDPRPIKKGVAALGDKKGRPVCCVCAKPATNASRVQVNWFRGDDAGPYKACEDHKLDAAALLAASVNEHR